MCFAPQRRALFHLSSGQLARHPPLWRAYFSTLRSLKSLEKHSVSRLSYLFAHLHLLSSDSFSSLIFSLLIFLFSLPLPCSAFHLSILSEVWILKDIIINFKYIEYIYIYNYVYMYIYIYMCNMCIYIYTGSTAQGGGGSFKNRKPIGEVGCCESGMAKRIHWWTERCLRSPLCLSLSLTIYLPIYLLCIYLSI